MLTFLYHEQYSFQIQRYRNNKSKEIQISELQNYNLQIYRKNCSNAEIQNTKLKKYNLHKCKNTKDRIAEIQGTIELWMTFKLWVTFHYG